MSCRDLSWLVWSGFYALQEFADFTELKLKLWDYVYW